MKSTLFGEEVSDLYPVHWIIKVVCGFRYIQGKMVKENTQNVSRVKYLHHPKRIFGFVKLIKWYFAKKKRDNRLSNL